MAGDSARDFARRQREKAARLERSAEKWERGADGEAATAAALDALKAHGWTTFHDVRWPGRQRANIDHVAVGPGGVFVIDSKNWSGDVRVVGNVLYQGSRHREREVAAAADAALSVTQLLQGFSATPVLCFVRPEPIDGWVRDVMVCSTANLAARLAGQPPVLGPESIRRVITILQWQLSSSAHPTPGRFARRGRALRQVPPVPSTPRPVAARRRVFPRFVAIGCATVLDCSHWPSSPDSLWALSETRPGWSGPATNHSGSAGSDASSAPVLGDVVHLPASTTHPAVELRADKVTRAADTGPEYGLPEGRHLVGVRYRIRNEGKQMWGAGPPYLRFWLWRRTESPGDKPATAPSPPGEQLPRRSTCERARRGRAS